jgi:hypothetical protein
MFAPVSAETIDLKQCHVCAAEQLDHDNFCCHCGASQCSGSTGSSDSLRDERLNLTAPWEKR